MVSVDAPESNIWTTVRFCDDRVVFHKRLRHVRGRLAAIVALLFVGGAFLRMTLDPRLDTTPRLLVIGAVLGIFLYAVASAWRLLQTDERLWLEVLDDADAAAGPRRLSAGGIRGVEVTSAPPERPDAPGRWLISVRLDDGRPPLVVYQELQDQRDQVMDLAQRLARRWRVDLSDV